MKRIDIFILSFILFIALILRLYKINSPLADLHSWRQADTAAVARNFVSQGFDLLHPRYDDLSNVQSGYDNPQGYRMVEFPIYNAIFAFAYKQVPIITLEQWGRIISIFFSLITISVIYYLTLKEKNRTTAFFSGFIFATFPYFVFFSRSVLPESTALGLAMLSIFFLYISKSKNSIRFLVYFLFSLISFSMALLIKPTIIFYAIPLFYLFFKMYKWQLLKNPPFYFYFIISIIPLFLWRSYIKTYPEGIPVNEWLLTSVNTGNGLQNIFFRPAFFRWIFFERINNLILGGYLTFFFILGAVSKQKNFFFFFFLISSVIYLFTFQGGNVQHEYYQTLIFPTLTIFSALGINYLFENGRSISNLLSPLIVFFILLSSWFFSYYQVKNYYNYSSELVQEANIIKSLTQPDDKIVTDRMGDTTLLYLSERRGSPSIYKNDEELQKLGYSYLITSSQTEIEILKFKYRTVFENEKFSIFKL